VGDYSAASAYAINNSTFGPITRMKYNPKVIQIGAY
jgi:hypothetical protein